MSAPFRTTLAGLAMLVVITAVAYLPVTWAGFVWDDGDLVTHNRNIRSLQGLAITWFEPSNGGRFYPDYYPLTYTTWAIEYQLYGLHPLGYHLNNVLLHAVNACLVWLVLRRLEVPGALLAAAIFAAHPAHVESVAWVSQRKTVLSGLCFLLSAWSFLAAFDPVEQQAQPAVPEGSGAASGVGRRRAGVVAFSLALYALAMLAKPVTMTLAGVLPLLLWWRRGRLTWREIWPAMPYLALALPMAVLTTWFQHHHVLLAGQEPSFAPLERVLIAGRVIVFYLGTLAWPVGLCFAYPRWTIDTAAAWQYLFPAGVAAALALLWLGRRRVGSGPLIAALFFGIVLSPALGFINILWHRYYFVADHVQYLASLGPITALAALAATAMQSGSIGRWWRNAVRIGVVCVIAALIGLSFNQARTYESKSVLWNDVLAKNPRSWLAMIYLGAERVAAGDLAGAREFWERALEVEPGAYEAHYNLGVMAEQTGDPAAAAEHFEHAIAIKPNFPAALNASAKALVREGDLRQAEARFRRALASNPHLADAHYNLGLLLAATQRPDEARRHYDLALRHNPGLTAARAAAQGLPPLAPAPADTRPGTAEP